MDRRAFFTTSALASGVFPASLAVALDYSDYSKDPRPDVADGAWTAGGPDGPVFSGSSVVSGPAAEEICILQPVQRLATGYLEFAVEGGEWQRVDADDDGLAPLSEHVLKFRLPSLPAGKNDPSSSCCESRWLDQGATILSRRVQGRRTAGRF